MHGRAHAAGQEAARALQTFNVGPLEANARFDANWAVQARPAAPADSPRVRYRPRSVRFDKMFDPATYAVLKKDPFRIHFQYLMASELPVDNDFFTLTAGPWPLEHWMDAA